MIWLLAIAGSVLAVGMVLASPLSQWFGQSTTLALLLGGLAGLFGGLLVEQARRIRRLEQALRARDGNGHAEADSEPALEKVPDRSSAAPISQNAKPKTAGDEKIPRRPPAPPRTALDDGIAALLARVRGWLFDGNLPVKIGVLVSFVGIAALLRFAADQGWLRLPIELRLSAVAAAALAALAFAWRQRERRRVFSLALQGGAVGVLVMTVFAAFALYSLMPSALAFALLLLLVVATAMLAVAQTSQVLAVLGLIAAFATPILVSSGRGGPIELFGYYLVVNFGVLGLAWRQHWPLLNRLGFVFTFIVATLWGVLDYRPARYAATQPFLVLFFLFYAAIPVLHAISGRDAGHNNRRLDVLLVFGLPLIAFPLQFSLVDGRALEVAFSALAMAAIYTLGAWYVRRRAPEHPLWPAQAALALGFATLAIPFALSGPVIALVWAVEGAALVWLGIVQQRRLTRLAGLVLQVVAGLAWFATVGASFNDYSRTPLILFNPPVLGALSLVLAAVFSARLFARANASAALLNLLAAWALGWWLTGGAVEIAQQLADTDHWVNAMIAFLGVTAWLAARAHRAYPLWVTALATTGTVALSLAMVVPQVAFYEHVFAGWGVPTWLLFVLAARAAEHELRAAGVALRGVLAMLVHLVWIVVPAVALVQLADDFWLLGSGWQWLAAALPAVLIGYWLMLRGTTPLSPSLPARQRMMVTGVVAGIVFGGVLYSLPAIGNPSPLGFVPVLNPLELAQLGALLLLATSVPQLPARVHRFVWAALGAAGLLVVSAMWLRLAHHGYGVAWSLDALLDSNRVQAGLSVLWTLLAVVLWVTGSRLRRHAVWWAGALLLGVVLIKLLLVDRQFLSTVAGIVSFLAFGGLCIAVGFLAPAPPKDMNQEGYSR